MPPRARARSRVGGRPPAADRSRRPRSAIGAPLLPAAHTTRRSVAAHRPRSITRTDHKHWLARMAASPAEVRFDYASNGPVIRSLFSLEAVARHDASPGAIKVASRRAARGPQPESAEQQAQGKVVWCQGWTERWFWAWQLRRAAASAIAAKHF